MDLTKEQHQILRKSQEMLNGDSGNDLMSVRRINNEPYKKSPNSLGLKWVRQVKSKVV
jgi:hypothetical protein